MVRPLLALVATLTVLALPSAAVGELHDNGPIAFVSDRDGDTEIYVQAIDGSGLVNLTSAPGVDQSPAWSPDGSRVAFTSFRDGRQAVYVMNADGTDQHRVSPESAFADDATPAWSPDGSRLVFASTRPFGDSWAIWSMSADGSDLRRVTDAFSIDPSWSPDGSLIAYSGLDPATGVLGVHVTAADGSYSWRATTGASQETGPAWSPDGRWLVFARDAGANAQELVLVNPFDQTEQRITGGGFFDANPAWSPDMRWIVFQRHLGTASWLRQLHVVSTSGGEPFPLDGFAGGEPDWSVLSETTPPPPVDPAPTITVHEPRDSGSYVLGSSWTTFFTCRDGDERPTCEATVRWNDRTTAISSGDALPTGEVGPHELTVRARDAAGQETVVTRWYWVVYDTSGLFDAPVAPFPRFTEQKAGQELPLRFSLSGDHGLDVLRRGPVSREVSCDAPEFGQWGDPASGKLHYNATHDRYAYVWETQRGWAGTCRQFVMTLDDTSYWYAYVRFTK